MKPIHRSFVGISSIVSLFICGCDQAAQPTNLGVAERWQPFEIQADAPLNVANPWLVRYEATVTAPDHSTVKVLGFHDGGQSWKLRVMPHSLGLWTVVTDSDQSALAGKHYQFTCTDGKPASQHGRLRVDADHPHHFIFEDGTHHFMLAYECDWLWALDTNDPKMPRTNTFLDRINARGFNTVIVNSYAYDTSWRPGKSGPDDFGPPPQSPWQGPAETPDHLQLNAEYWQHYDRMIQALHQRGMIVHMLCKVYNKKVKWPGRGTKGDDLFFRTLIARYGAYPGMVWDFSKEAHNEKDLDYKLDRLRFLRESDPWHHLVTVHDDDKNYESGTFDKLVDFRTDQQHSIWRKKILQQRAQRDWPVMNSEFGYEHGAGGLKDKTYAQAQSPEEVVRRAWEISMAGGYTAYYHTHTAWDVLRPEIDPPGYRLFGRLRSFFETTRYWELCPRSEVPNGCWLMENPGREYVFWVPSGQSAQVTIPAYSAPMSATWLQPLSGEQKSLAKLAAGEHLLAAPSEFPGGGDAVLHLFQDR